MRTGRLLSVSAVLPRVCAIALSAVVLMQCGVGAASAREPAGLISPGQLRALLLTNDQVRAALPPTVPAFELNGGICERLSGASTAGLGRLTYCQTTLTLESAYALKQDPNATYPWSLTITSFPTGSAARKGLADQRRKHTGHGWSVSDASSRGFSASAKSDKVTSTFAVAGSNLVETACGGPDAAARLSCSKALNSAQRSALPRSS